MTYLSRRTRLLIFAALAAALTWISCKDDGTSSPSPFELVQTNTAGVPLEWMKLFLELDRYAQGYRPGPAARALAYINLAAYESCLNGMPHYLSLQNLYAGLSLPTADKSKDYHWPTVLNAVYASMIQHFFPGQALAPGQQTDLLFKILELQEAFSQEFSAKVGNTIFNRSEAHGEAVADAIWEWSKTDQFGHDAYLFPRPASYVPLVGPGLWKPTPPDFSAALFPYWGNVRTFSIQPEDKIAKSPLTFSQESTSPLYAQGLEVRNTVENLTFNEQWIAEFWSDDFTGQTFSPASRWISIACQVIKNEDSDLETAIYAFSKLSLALNDAAVACWHSKYIYNVERPVTYINRVIDSTWKPHWDSTPSFPAYPSGHATFGAAAAETLSHVFGYNFAMTDSSHEGRDEFLSTPRSFASFYEMANENAYSRIPLGVHFQMDADEGLRLGFRIGRKVNEMPFKK